MESVRRIGSARLGRSRGYGVNVIIENLSRACCRNGAGRALRAIASIAVAAASLVAPAAAYGTVQEKAEQNITFSIPTSLRCAVKADGTVIAPSGWSMSNSGSGKVEITGVSVSNAIGKLKLSGKSGSVGYAVGEGSGSYAVSYDAADGCKFSSTLNRPLGIESGKTLSWNWNIGKLNASDHRAALDSAASGRARLCDMSFSYASVGNSLSSEGTTGSISGAVNSQSSSVLPVGGTATANVGNVPANASLSYQWYTVDSNGSYSAIANANGKTLKVLAAYRGKDIVCRVSDSSGHYSGYVETARKPVRNLAPKVGISGSSVYGGKLTASVSGLPSGTTYTYKYKWQRLSGSSWVDIANATAAEYALGGEDVGKQVRVIVSTASNIYTVDDVTAVSATVAKAKASIGVSISGTKNNSSKLTASVSGLPGSGANTVSYRWQRSSDGKSNWVDSTAGDAKSNSIQMQPNDVSWHYRCIVSASNPYYDIASSTSAAYGPIAKSTVSAAKATISGNAVYGGTIKANVTNVPTVGTNSISYQWQYSEDGKAWNDTRLNGGKASSLVLSAVSCVGTQYRCVISVDNSYYIVPGCTTNTVKVGKASAQAVAKASGEAVAGKELTVAVSGLPTVGGTNKVYYQWQFSNDGKTWGGSTLDGATTSTLHLYDSDNVAHSMVGFSYRCVVSVSGNSAYDIKSATSNVVGPVVKGTAAAPSVSVGGTKKIESTLKATVTGLPKYGNSNVSYQWQTSADGSKWVDSAQSDAKSVSFKPAYSLVNQYVRCAVSVSNDQYNVATGYSAAFGKLGKASKTISAVITSPNKRNGDTLTCGISGLASNGSNTIAYKWECADNSAFTSNVEGLDDRGNAHVTSVGTGTYYRCTVTAGNPYYEYNTAVSPAYGPLAKGVASAPTVTVSGSNAWGSTLKATVTGLPKYGNNKVSYQWEARDDSLTAWGNSGYATATTDHITVNAQDAVSKARHYRCKVTVDNDQYTVPVAYSADHGKTVKASATAKAAISGTAVIGGKLSCSVSGLPMSGSNSVSYQWQYSNDNKTWTNSTYTDAKTSAHSLGYKGAYNLYWRCSVSVSNPYYSVPTAYTDSRLCGKGTASITASISGNAVIGGKLTCSVGGLPSIGTNSVKYKWQYSSDGKAWADSLNATASSNSITLPPDATLGKCFRCVVSATNDVYNGMSATSAASARVGKGSHSAPSVSISGAKVYGSTLTASVSEQPGGTTGTSYQWQRNSGTNGAWVNISNATGKTYVLTGSDMNYSLRVLVNTSNTYYNVSQGVSAAYGPIGKSSHGAPTVSVSGSKTYGSTLTANVSGQPNGTTATSYQWQRASSAIGAWSNISNATGKTYKLGTGDMNQYLRVLVGTTSTYYNVSQGVSAAYGAIGKASATVSATVSGTKNNTSKLTVSVGGLPSVGTNTVSYQWQRSNNGSTGWTNSTYSDGKSNAIQMKEPDVAYYYRCIVTVSGNAYYNINGATSAAYGPIGKSSHSAPSVSVSGDKTVGATLTASVSGQPSGTTSTTYQWQRASSASGSYSNISGATGRTYKTVDADANKYVRVLVNTVNTYYAVSQGVSAGYGAILITRGEANLDYTEDEQAILKCTYNTALTITPIYQWYRNGQPIENATKNTYKLTEADCGKNIECHVSDGNQELKGYLSDNKNIPVLKTVNLDANGGKFSDGSTKHTIKYIQESELVIKYSHTDNIDDEGNATGTYKANLSTNDVVTIPGATKLTIDVWHATGVKLYDWLAIYPKGITPSSLNYLKATISNGKLGGSFATEKDSATHDTFEVNDDTAQFYFKSNGISEYYGYYAVVKGNCQINKIISGSNETYIPNYTGYRFDSWNTSIDGRGDKIDNILGNEDNITLYAKYEDMRSAFAVYCENDKSLNFYKRMNIPSVGDTFNGRAVTAVYTGIEKDSYDYTTRPWQQYQLDIITSTIVDDGIAPVSTAFWFYNCSKLTSVNNLNKLNTSKVTNMAFMFSSAYDLTSVSDLSKWDTSNVTNMGSMFDYCHRLTSVGDLSGWNTSNVTDMSQTFYYCEKLVSFGNISVWDTSKVINMMGMFSGCKSLNPLDLSKWNTSKVRKMNGMFEYCSSFTSLDLSKWNTSKVTDMGRMFYNCSSLTSVGDLSKWNTLYVSDMNKMFYNCSSLTSVGDLSKWNTSKVNFMDAMFNNCSKLSLNCSNWNVSKVINHNDFNTNAPRVIAPTWTSSDEVTDEDSVITLNNESEIENKTVENIEQEDDNNKNITTELNDNIEESQIINHKLIEQKNQANDTINQSEDAYKYSTVS